MVILIGAAGFLGPTVLKKLLENNYDVNCLVRTDSDRSGLLDASILLDIKIFLVTVKAALTGKGAN
ncbi:unnamed protein product [marine sediment metagenome]|uniref:Thioester reductase (TE) domain-containing protein n=1 Tax=marine sediment metagenome TaxID=412755 RepID=X1AFV1_9ZZZZ